MTWQLWQFGQGCKKYLKNYKKLLGEGIRFLVLPLQSAVAKQGNCPDKVLETLELRQFC